MATPVGPISSFFSYLVRRGGVTTDPFVFIYSKWKKKKRGRKVAAATRRSKREIRSPRNVTFFAVVSFDYRNIVKGRLLRPRHRCNFSTCLPCARSIDISRSLSEENFSRSCSNGAGTGERRDETSAIFRWNRPVKLVYCRPVTSIYAVHACARAGNRNQTRRVASGPFRAIESDRRRGSRARRSQTGILGGSRIDLNFDVLDGES